MDRISSEEALSILSKWNDERAILELGFNDRRTGGFRKRWLLVHGVTSGGSPSAIFSVLERPFPFVRVSLAGVEFEYGDDRGFEDAPLEVLEEMRGKWVSCLVLLLPSGQVLLLSELRRELESGSLEE